MNNILNATRLLSEWYETNDVDTIINNLGVQLKYFDQAELNIGIDAFSYKSTIFLSTGLSSYHEEFLKLHELGHLILHEDATLDRPLAFTDSHCTLEHDANYFAAIMLSEKYKVPINDMLFRLTELFNINILLKKMK